MSIVSVRAALETQLNTISPAISTVWENWEYSPTTGTPWQAAYVLFAAPDNPTMGDGYHRILGIFQVNLFYPIGTGTGTAAARAELIKAAFPRGSSFTSGGVKVRIDKTPEIGTGRNDAGWFMIPIKIPFFVDINS